MKQSMAVRMITVALLLCMVALAMGACTAKKSNEDTVFAVSYDDVVIELGASAEDVLDALGSANSEDEVFDCGAGNSRIRYRYDSFTLYVMKSDGEQVIDQIELKDDLIQTTRKIALGSSEAEVRDAYGNPTKAENGIIYVPVSLLSECFGWEVADLGEGAFAISQRKAEVNTAKAVLSHIS